MLLDSDGRVESKQFVVLSKGSTVTIPANLRYGLGSGQEVIIYPESEAIVIKKKEFESIENQAIIGRYGSLYIPKEIRKFKNLLPGTKFLIIDSYKYRNNSRTIISNIFDLKSQTITVSSQLNSIIAV